jgi:hypothetical protein
VSCFFVLHSGCGASGESPVGWLGNIYTASGRWCFGARKKYSEAGGDSGGLLFLSLSSCRSGDCVSSGGIGTGNVLM